LRPYISDKGANSNGPEPNPIRNVGREQPNSAATIAIAAVWIDEQNAIVAVMNVTSECQLDQTKAVFNYNMLKGRLPTIVQVHFLADENSRGFSLRSSETASNVIGLASSGFAAACASASPFSISIVACYLITGYPFVGKHVYSKYWDIFKWNGGVGWSRGGHRR
jgi:hypothetical protein